MPLSRGQPRQYVHDGACAKPNSPQVVDDHLGHAHPTRTTSLDHRSTSSRRAYFVKRKGGATDAPNAD
jgi:hypothetical protein